MATPDRPAARFHTSTVRRVVGALAALALAGGLAAGPAVAAAAEATSARSVSSGSTGSSAADILAADLESLVDRLSPRHRAALRAGDPHIAGTGLRLGDLAAAERDLALALLPSLLSTEAWAQIADLVASDSARGALDDYALALFGDLDADFVLQVSTPDLVLIAIRQGADLEVAPELVA